MRHSGPPCRANSEQLEYEAKKAFEQYDAADARNRLAAGELERRWNEKLRRSRPPNNGCPASTEALFVIFDEEARIRFMG